MTTTISLKMATVFAIVLFALALPNTTSAHCDTMNGPVVLAAKKALETGNINYALIWVRKPDETRIKEAFNKTLEVRKLNGVAKELADMYFFETLVRIHREGEGVPYTGIKSSETAIEPGIHAAERAIEKGTVKEILDQLNHAIREIIEKHFHAVVHKKNFKTDNVTAGREYVLAYVEFIHLVERLYQVAEGAGGAHEHEAEPQPDKEHKH